MQIFIVLALLIAIVAVVFAVQNTAMITVSFLVWSFEGSLALVLLATLLVGVLIGTYSSIYVASPIVLTWEERSKKKK